MHLYRLEFRAGVRKTVDTLPGHLRQQVKAILQDLRQEPRPPIAEPMRDEFIGCYKIRLGPWRLVYEVQDNNLVVLVLKVGKKAGPEFYRDLSR
jgi:mRNA interferase RelE/StbE